MKQFLLSFLLTSLSTSILVLLLSLLFTAFKTKISVRVKYFIWFLILLSFVSVPSPIWLRPDSAEYRIGSSDSSDCHPDRWNAGRLSNC